MSTKLFIFYHKLVFVITNNNNNTTKTTFRPTGDHAWDLCDLETNEIAENTAYVLITDLNYYKMSQIIIWQGGRQEVWCKDLGRSSCYTALAHTVYSWS